MNTSVKEVIVDNEIRAANTSYEVAVSIKDRALSRGANQVRLVYNRGTHLSSYIFKNIKNYKENNSE